MFTYPFEILKKRLTDQVTELREIDWYMNQDDLKDKNALLVAAPALYIQFLPVQLEDLGYGMQKGEADFDIILLTETMHTTGSKRLKKEQPQDHMRLFDKVYKNIAGFSSLISYLPEFAALEDTANDLRIMNTIRRLGVPTPPHGTLKGIMKSVQRFRTIIWDHVKLPALTVQSPTPPVEIVPGIE